MPSFCISYDTANNDTVMFYHFGRFSLILFMQNRRKLIYNTLRAYNMQYYSCNISYVSFISSEHDKS